jgi:hypothetical protein
MVTSDDGNGREDGWELRVDAPTRSLADVYDRYWGWFLGGIPAVVLVVAAIVSTISHN